jgi:hypothetical protein
MSVGVFRLWHAGRDALENLGGPVGSRLWEGRCRVYGY